MQELGVDAVRAEGALARADQVVGEPGGGGAAVAEDTTLIAVTVAVLVVVTAADARNGLGVFADNDGK